MRRPWTAAAADADDAHMTVDRLRELLHYDPETGIFTWRVTKGPARAGAAAGCLEPGRYHLICVDGVLYKAHRLAWFYMTGEWPKNKIDHRNCIKNDNRFANLREATNAQNTRNSPLHRDSISGFKGVQPLNGSNRNAWRASITHGGRKRHLGCFPTAEDAHAAYCRAVSEIDPEFARFS